MSIKAGEVHARAVALRALRLRGRARMIAASSPVARLRAETRAQHQALERSYWLSRATASRFTYAVHLNRVASIYRDAEHALAPFYATLEAHGFAPHARRRLPVLSELNALGSRDDQVYAAFFPIVTNVSEALGCWYVLEGSTMGGALIAKTIRKHLRWESPFYTGYGDQTMPMWRAFVAALDELGPQLNVERLVFSANAMFC